MRVESSGEKSQKALTKQFGGTPYPTAGLQSTLIDTCVRVEGYMLHAETFTAIGGETDGI
jgi:hypothetical protein